MELPSILTKPEQIKARASIKANERGSLNRRRQVSFSFGPGFKKNRRVADHELYELSSHLEDFLAHK